MRFLKTKRKLLSKHFLHLIDYYSTISNFTNMNMNINSVSLKHFVLIEKHPIRFIQFSCAERLLVICDLTFILT